MDYRLNQTGFKINKTQVNKTQNKQAEKINFKADNYSHNKTIESQKTFSSINLQAYHIIKPKISFGRHIDEHLGYGAQYLGDDTVKFKVDAPKAKKIWVEIRDKNSPPLYDEDQPFLPEYAKGEEWSAKAGNGNQSRIIPMKEVQKGVFEVKANEIPSGSRYRYVFFDEEHKFQKQNDPRSAYLPSGVYGWSEIVDHKSFKWNDEDWKNGKEINGNKRLIHKGEKDEYGIPPETTIEEIHIGLLGGYKNAKKEIDKLAEEGICNSIEIMPSGEFYGNKNWGYDEVAKFAPQSSYGNPDELKELIDYAHQKGINVILDIVPNHFGPFGDVTDKYGKSFSNENLPWGKCLNFQDDNDNYMRNYMVDCAMNWLINYHCDGLRLDAVHSLGSDSTLKLIASEIRNHSESKNCLLIGEDYRKSKRTVSPLTESEKADPLQTLKEAQTDPVKRANIGLGAVWNFDIAHTIQALTTGMKIFDCTPSIYDLEAEFKNGFKEFEKQNNGLADTANFASEFISGSYGYVGPEPKTPPINTMIGYHSCHDEISYLHGARLITQAIARNLGLSKDYELDSTADFNKKPFFITNELVKSYIRKDDDKKWENLQKDLGITNIITKEDFNKAYNLALSKNKLALGTLFMYPGPKMMFMGDQRGELAPFKFFADYPKDAKFDGIPASEKVSAEFGYNVTSQEPLEDSKLNQDKYKDKNLETKMLNFSKDMAKLNKENPALTNGNSENLRTYIYKNQYNQPDNIMHIHRYQDGNEILAVLNFSDDNKQNFELKSMPDGEWKEILNSNNSKYGGDNTCLNENTEISREQSTIKMPKQSIVIFKRVK